MILSADGTPTPPREIVARLQRIDPDLDVRWCPCGPDPKQAYYGIFYKWRENDARWQRVQSGEIGPERAADMLLMLPLDCSVDEAYSYFVNNVRVTTDDNVRRLMDRIHCYNEKLEEEQWEPIIEEGVEHVAARASKTLSDLGIRPRSHGGLPDAPNPIEAKADEPEASTKPKKKRGK